MEIIKRNYMDALSWVSLQVKENSSFQDQFRIISQKALQYEFAYDAYKYYNVYKNVDKALTKAFDEWME